MVQFAQHLKGNLDNNVSFMGWAGSELDEKNGVLNFHFILSANFILSVFLLMQYSHHRFFKKL